jgi:excisionase family DNA binding protein
VTSAAFPRKGRCEVGCSSAETFGRITPNGKAVQWDESTLIALIREEVRRVMDEASGGGGPGGETMDVRELTALLGLNRKTVYGLIACGEIPGVRRLGRRIVVHRATVIRWLGNGQGSVPRSRR